MMLKGGWNWIAAGIVSLAAIILGTFFLRLPLFFTGPIGLLAFGSVVYALREKRPAKKVGSTTAPVRSGLAKELSSEAEAFARRIRIIAGEVDPEVGKTLQRISLLSDFVLARLDKDPNALPTVQRLLTFYLPQVADFAEKYKTLTIGKSSSTSKAKEVRTMINEIEGVFQHYLAELDDDALDGLSVDLRVMRSTIRADIKR